MVVGLMAQACPTLCDPLDCSLTGSSVHSIFQTRILEWVAVSFSRGISLTQESNPHLLGLLHCKKILYYLSHFGCGCAAHPSSLLSLGTSPARFKERGYGPISQLEACQRICDYFLKPPEGVRSCVPQSSWDPYCPSWQLLVTCDCLNIN